MSDKYHYKMEESEYGEYPLYKGDRYICDVPLLEVAKQLLADLNAAQSIAQPASAQPDDVIIERAATSHDVSNMTHFDASMSEAEVVAKFAAVAPSDIALELLHYPSDDGHILVRLDEVQEVLARRAAVAPSDAKDAAGWMVPLSKDGESVWIEGEGDVSLCRCTATSASDVKGKADTRALCMLVAEAAHRNATGGKALPSDQVRAIVDEVLGAKGKADAAIAGGVKDHVIRETVNKLRDIALEYHATGQLRARIADLIVPLLQVQSATSAADAKDAARLPRTPTEAMLNAARDWSVKKYGIGVGNDDATGCWQAMYDAAMAAAPSNTGDKE